MNQAIDRFKKERMLKLLKTADRVKTSALRTPYFDITPKIHKPGNPGRPVVSSCNCHTGNNTLTTKYNPLQKQIASCIKDANDSIIKFNDIGKNPPNSYLVTMDVKSL